MPSCMEVGEGTENTPLVPAGSEPPAFQLALKLLPLLLCRSPALRQFLPAGIQAGLDTRREELAERRAAAEEEWQEFQRQLESRRLRPRWDQRRIFRAFPHLHAGRHQEAVEKLREYWKSRK